MRWRSLQGFALFLMGACTRGADPVPPDGRPVPPSGSVAMSGGAAQVPGAPVVRYLALGDSFTIGTGSPRELSFPARLAERMRARGATVTLENLGVNGYRTDELLEREAPRIGTFHPTLVTLAIGANDLVNGSSAEYYRSQLKLIFKEIDAASVPHGRVYVVPQPDWSKSVVADSFGDRAKIQGGIRSFNVILQEEAAAWGARFVDLWPLMEKQADEKLIAGDGLHPSAPAYEAWAAAIAEVLPPDVLGPANAAAK